MSESDLLKAAAIGVRILATLSAQTERNRQTGIARRAEIRALFSATVDPDRLTARQVRPLLSGQPLSVRRIQKYLQAIRAESSVRRS